MIDLYSVYILWAKKAMEWDLACCLPYTIGCSIE